MYPQVSNSAQEQAYSFLKEAILSGKLSGGTRVDMSRVAIQLGMSRMPVREALRQLHAEGLVTIRPHRGVVVTQLTPDDVLELFEMRAVLEGLATRLAIPNLDAEAFDDLAHILERMERSPGNTSQWLRLHNEFHDCICRGSGRPRLSAQTALLRRAVEPYLRVHVGAYGREEVAGAEHGKLLEILRQRDPERAEWAMREHIERAAAFIVGFLRSSGPHDPVELGPAPEEPVL